MSSKRRRVKATEIDPRWPMLVRLALFILDKFGLATLLVLVGLLMWTGRIESPFTKMLQVMVGHQATVIDQARDISTLNESTKEQVRVLKKLRCDRMQTKNELLNCYKEEQL